MFNDDEDNPIQQPEQPATPWIPPLRTFKVRRFKPGTFGENGENIEELVIEGHTIDSSDHILRIGEYVVEMTPQGPVPTSYVRRALNGWIEYEELPQFKTNLRLN